MNTQSFNPLLCDLCGSTQFETILSLSTGRAMRSDRAVTAQNIHKVACSNCGLVRSGETIESTILSDYYTDQYTLSTQTLEHYFYTEQGPVSRSAMLCDWLVQSMGKHRWTDDSRCLEIGAGTGGLLQEFMQRFPKITFEGLELNNSAVAIAQSRSLPVRQGTFDVLEDQLYDIIYCIAVLEHVPSPTEFLKQIRQHLRPGGHLFLCQPTQDVPSYDVFFVDHLHHFGTDHLHYYALKCGFKEQGFCVGHPWMPNFSLHMWQATQTNPLDGTNLIYADTTCLCTVESVLQNITEFNNTLDTLAQRRVAVFGLNEVYWLARAYTALGDFPVVCGLDDMPDKTEYKQLKFPVVKPEDCVALGIQDVLLTMNKVYYPQATARIQSLGLTPHLFLQ